MPEKPIIALTGTLAQSAPQWLHDLRPRLEYNYTLKDYGREGFVGALADDYVALLLVDGDADDWVFWTATPKSSNATRRIPIFLVSEDAAVRHQALASGADLTFSHADAYKSLVKLVDDFARSYDVAQAEQLDCECAETLPPLAEQGVQQFNAGEFYAQHDSFEELWMATSGPVRDLYRAILQVGVAYFQIQQGNYRGAIKMLLRSVQWLTVLPDACQGIDVAALRADSYRVRAELARLGEARLDEFDLALLQPVKRVESDA